MTRSPDSNPLHSAEDVQALQQEIAFLKAQLQVCQASDPSLAEAPDSITFPKMPPAKVTPLVAAAPEAISQSQAALMHLLPVGIFRLDRQQHCTFVNQRLQEISGYNFDQISGTQWQALLHPGDRARVLQAWETSMSMQSAFREEYRFLRRDGSEAWVLSQAVLELSEEGEPQGYIGSVVDITDRHLAEVALRESQHRYAVLTELSPVGVFRLDAQGYCLYVNDRWCEITGLAVSEAMGLGWQRVIHPDDRTSMIEAGTNTVRQNQRYSSEFRFVRPDGTVTWVLGQALPELSDSGSPIAYVGTVTDITARKRAEAALQASTARLQLALEAVQFGDWELNLRQPPYSAIRSPRHDQIFGYETLLPEWSYDLFLQHVLPEHRAIVDERFQLALVDRTDWTFECQILRADGERRWIWAKGTVYSDEQGQPLRLLGLVGDITDRKQGELELQQRAEELLYLNQRLSHTAALLEQRNHELDQFAYVASHDLKAPLRAIANLSEWLEEDLAGLLPPENRQQMQLLRGRVYRMEALINGLLDYSRVGRLQTPIEQVNLDQLLAEVLDLLDPPPRFQVVIQPPMPSLMARRLPLMQVFSNLLSNAIKHHPRSDGQIVIQAQAQGAFYEFSVSDDGSGIAAANYDRIFAIFQTLESRDSKENTGIGLAIVKKIVESEGGTIGLTSEVGRGTTFTFTWPQQSQSSPETS